MEDSKNIVEIKTRLILHPNEDKVHEKGEFVKTCQENATALFASTIILCLVNELIVLLCFCGVPNIPSLPTIPLPSLEMPELGIKFNAINLEPCKIVAVGIPLAFLLTPFVFHRIIVAYEKQMNGKQCEPKKKIIDFVCQNPMLVFWTGYGMAFLNTIILALCYCGVPEITMPRIPFPEIPDLDFSFPSLPELEITGNIHVDLAINTCLTVTMFAIVLLVFVVPFMMLSPYSPFYEKMKSQRVELKRIIKSKKGKDDVKRGEESSKIVQFVAGNPQLSFWIGYSLTCLNIFLLIACFCQTPSFELPNLCNIAPFSIVCGLAACLINCATNSE